MENKYLEQIAACTAAVQLIPIYAELIWETAGKVDPDPRILEVNAAILARWARSTFVTVKTKAWRIYELRLAQTREALKREI